MTAIVGKYGVGKTSLLEAFITPGSGNGRCVGPTIGAAIVNQLFTVPDEDTMKRHTIWDTAGQERFESLVPMYTRNCDILILALPATEEPQQETVRRLLSLALPSIRSPKIVKGALTKCDMVSSEIVAQRRQQLHEIISQFAQAENREFDIHTFATSAYTGDGVEACIGSCIVEVYHHKHRQQTDTSILLESEPVYEKSQCGC